MWIFLVHTSSWGPIFHHAIAQSFSYDYYPFITEQQRHAFLLGAIYADGFDKSITHSTQVLLKYVRQVEDVDSDLYWFFKGVFIHVAPDVFAHAGRDPSFIASHGWKHRISEFILDSVFMHQEHLPFLKMPKDLSRQLQAIGIFPKPKFPYFYLIDWFLSKFPAWSLLRFFEVDKCHHPSLAYSQCNLMRHYDGMMKAMNFVMPKFTDKNFNDSKLRVIATALVYDLGCCNEEDVKVSNFSSHRFCEFSFLGTPC